MNEEIRHLIDQVKAEKDPFQKAKLILHLKTDKQIPLHEISERIEIKPSYTSHLLRLLKLPPLVVDGYSSDLISISHLFIISRLHSEGEMIDVYERVLSDNFTSAQTEELVRERLYGLKSEGEHLTKEKIAEFVQRQEAKGRKVRVIQTRRKGKLILEVEGDLLTTTRELTKLTDILDQATNEEEEQGPSGQKVSDSPQPQSYSSESNEKIPVL